MHSTTLDIVRLQPLDLVSTCMIGMILASLRNHQNVNRRTRGFIVTKPESYRME